MVKNKLEHTIIGIVICAIGFVGLSRQWLSPQLSILFIAMIAVGALWAWVIGHAWMVIPGLLIFPFEWIFEQLDPRAPAKVKRKAKGKDFSAISMRDLRYYGDELGHHFQYHFDDEGTLVVTDLGIRDDFDGHRIDFVLAIGHRTALVYDYQEDAGEWRKVIAREWIEEAEQTDALDQK